MNRGGTRCRAATVPFSPSFPSLYLKMKSIRQYISRFSAALALLTTLSGCDSAIYDSEGDCSAGVELRFVYDYNLESANAFPSQVDCLTLHLYDGSGKFITTLTETSGVLADEDYRMKLTLGPGIYHAIAYGGIECDKASFAHAAAPAAGSSYTGIDMALLPDHAGKRLHDHFHGAVDFTIEPEDYGYSRVTVKMTKTTNHIRVILQQLDGSPVDGNLFNFHIIDDNSHLDHRNNPVRGNNITYPAWDKGSLSTADFAVPGKRDAATDPEAPGQITVGYADLSTSRLTVSNPGVLLITEAETGREVARLPLSTYLAMGRSGADNWSDQEYLDRGSRWNLLFFLDRNNLWVKTWIHVNDWPVRINNIEF